MEELRKLSREIRIDILRMFYQSKTGHLAPALSSVDILVSLYFGGIINPKNFFNENRDRFILSKGHACAALYAVLARIGYFPRNEILTFYNKDSRLGGHPSIMLPGIESPTGSLGHGICFATGVAKAALLDRKSYKTYVIIGDGELQEGSVWEAAMFSSNNRLSNLIVILDKNNLQASSYIEDIYPIPEIKNKWKCFGWDVLECDGHDFQELDNVLNIAKKSNNEKPTIIIANTIKGKGISFIENNPEWHSRTPKNHEWGKVCNELGITMKELATI